MRILLKVAQADSYIVRVPAINAINDLVRLFGVETLTSKASNANQTDGEVRVTDCETESLIWSRVAFHNYFGTQQNNTLEINGLD